MLRYLSAAALAREPLLQDTMFRDRACQFHRRLGWEVKVDARGWEQDDYDREGPLYVIWQGRDGRHGGSMRFLPTTGRTMVNDHFLHLSQGGPVCDPMVWECTRFCLSDAAPPGVSAALMLGGAELGAGFGLSRAVGVFDARMVRIYRHLGWAPAVAGFTGEGRDAVGLGFWTFSEATRRRMAALAGLSPEVSRHWFRMALGEARQAA
jgi:acyl homoserine lactone synthase